MYSRCVSEKAAAQQQHRCSQHVITSPYSYDPQDNLYRFNPNVCHIMEYDRMMQMGREFVDLKPDKPQIYYIWGHSYEFDTEEKWEYMEKVVSTLAGKDNIWYATNIEIYDYITALRHCEMSADRSMLYNPSATSVWVIVDGNLIECKGGEHTKLF